MTSLALGSRYLLEEQIGQGGMGAVWRGRDRETGARYAIKVLPPEFARSAATVARFVRERTALVSFQHPNVVTLHDMIVEGDRLALVMDLVEGGDLEAYRRQCGGALSPSDALGLTAQICDGLAAAHAAGIVHRDLKPANVLLDGGRVRLADFGIARIADESFATTTGTVLGTAAFMAPEVIKGEEAGSPCDVYAAGITLYLLLTGAPPFTGQIPAIMHGHLEAAPPRPDGIPDRLWALLSACLSKDPAARPGAAAVARALRDPALLSGPVSAARPTGVTGSATAGGGPPVGVPFPDPAYAPTPVMAAEFGQIPTESSRFRAAAFAADPFSAGATAMPPPLDIRPPDLADPAGQGPPKRRRRIGGGIWAAAAAVVLLLVGAGVFLARGSTPGSAANALGGARPTATTTGPTSPARVLGHGGSSVPKPRGKAHTSRPTAGRSAVSTPGIATSATSVAQPTSSVPASTSASASASATAGATTAAATPSASPSVTPSVPEPTGPNFVADGDFSQTSLSAWDDYVLHATRTNSDLDGGYAVLLTPDPTAGVAQYITGLTPGTAYQLTGLISSPDGGATYIGVKKYDDTAGLSREQSVAAWTPVTMTFTPGPGHTSAMVFCWRSVTNYGLCTDVSVRALG